MSIYNAPTRALGALAQRGVSFQYQYVHDLSKAPSGADGDRDWFGRYSWDLSAAIDGEKAMGWIGGSLFLHAKQHQEEVGKLYDGVAQGYSNIDADSQTSLYEAWAEQLLFSDRLQIKTGRIDANTDFDVVSTASDFLNSSMGYSPTIMEFPSYPTPQIGADVSVALGKAFKANVGEFKTQDGTIMIAEADRLWAYGQNQYAGRASFGVWNLREPVTRFCGDTVSGSHGFYGVLEQSIWKRPLPGSGDKNQSLQSFLQIGTGDGRENPYTLHIGGGTVLSGPLRRRPADEIGIAATWVRFTSEPEGGFDAHDEMVVETYYKVSLSHSLALITDVQYFHHPGGILAHVDSVITTPRVVVSF